MNSNDLTPLGMGIDSHAVLFKSNGKILRAINPKYESFYLRLLDNKVIIELMNIGILIKTVRSSTKIKGFNVVLEHPIIPIVSYPFEWTCTMQKDAAMLILDLNIALIRTGYCTQDAHPWNVLFDGPNPVFVDFTSIIKLPNNKWVAYNEFKEYCLNTLMLISKGYVNTARRLNREIFYFPDSVLAKNLPSLKFKKKYKRDITYEFILLTDHFIDFSKNFSKRLIRKILRAKQNSSDAEYILLLKDTVENIDSSPIASAWSDYYSGTNELPVFDGTQECMESIRNSTPKHQIIDQIIKNIKPSTVLDLGCNRGLYCQIAASHGASVIGIDMDENAIDNLYTDSKKYNSNILTLYANSVAPAEAIGFKEIPFQKFTDRVKSECVLCLALVHHLVFKRTHMSFSHISKVLNSYSTKYLIVEFVPKEDKYVSEWYNEDYEWYTCDNFVSELKNYFSDIVMYESFPKTRVILFCTKYSSGVCFENNSVYK